MSILSTILCASFVLTACGSNTGSTQNSTYVNPFDITDKITEATTQANTEAETTEQSSAYLPSTKQYSLEAIAFDKPIIWKEDTTNRYDDENGSKCRIFSIDENCFFTVIKHSGTSTNSTASEEYDAEDIQKETNNNSYKIVKQFTVDNKYKAFIVTNDYKENMKAILCYVYIDNNTFYTVGIYSKIGHEDDYTKEFDNIVKTITILNENDIKPEKTAKDDFGDLTVEKIKEGKCSYKSNNMDYSKNTYTLADNSSISWAQAVDLLNNPEKFTEESYRQLTIDVYCVTYFLYNKSGINYTVLISKLFNLSDENQTKLTANIKSISQDDVSNSMINAISNLSTEDIDTLCDEYIKIAQSGSYKTSDGITLNLKNTKYDNKYLFTDIMCGKYKLTDLSEEGVKLFVLDSSILAGQVIGESAGMSVLITSLEKIGMTSADMQLFYGVYQNNKDESEIMTLLYERTLLMTEY